MSPSILDNLDIVATLAGGFFAGTVLCVTICEVPALRELGLDENWRFFPYAHKRAATSQASFTVIASIASIVHGIRINGASFDRHLWILAGSVFVGVIPYTLFCMLPTNLQIINDNKRVELGNESQINVTRRKELLEKWAKLHLVRTIGSFVGFSAMIFGLSRHSLLLLGW